MKKILAGAAALLGTAVSAQAADMALRFLNFRDDAVEDRRPGAIELVVRDRSNHPAALGPLRKYSISSTAD